MSKDEQFQREFHEYLQALNTMGEEGTFISLDDAVEKEKAKRTNEENLLFWGNLAKERDKFKEKNKIRNSAPREIETQQVDMEVSEDLSDTVNRINKMIKSLLPEPDTADSNQVNGLTEEEIKNAVKDGVVEGLNEFIEELKSQGARGFYGGGF